MRLVVPLCAVLPVFVAACAPQGETAVSDSAATATTPTVDVAAVRQSIERSDSIWADAIKRGDAATVASVYTEDAISLLNGMPALRGKQAIQEGTATMFKDIGLKDAKVTTNDVEVHGDLALEMGTYEMTMRPPGAKADVVDKGKFLAVWKKQADGTWKLYRDAPSSDVPPPK